MATARCPTCRKSLRFQKTADLPFFPFCSDRCRLIDLGKWADESYKISTHLDRDSEERPPETDASTSDPKETPRP